MLFNRLIERKLVDISVERYSEHVLQDSWEFIPLMVPKLVEEYVSRKLDAIDICNVLEKGSQESFMERKKFLLATFLPICQTRHTNLEFALSLGQFYYEKWDDDQLYTLLGTEAENAILLASQPHKKTQRDVDALLHLLNCDKMRTWAAASILAQLSDHFYGDDILQHRSIQGLIQNLKHQWKFHDCYYPCTTALKLVKYRTFAEQFAIDEDCMEIFTNTIIQNHVNYFCYWAFDFLFELSQQKNIFYQTDTKIPMKNILKQISSMLIQTIKSSGLDNVYKMLDFSLRYEDLAMQIIDKCGDDIVLGIFDNFLKLPNLMPRPGTARIGQLFLILERLANRKGGEAIIIKHAHLLLRSFQWNDRYDNVMSNGLSTLVRYKGIAQALITQEGVELLVNALEQGKITVVPLVLQCLFFENEEFTYKVIARGGWRMMTKGLQLITRKTLTRMQYGLQFMPLDDMLQFSLMHIAKEMASKGEIQELVMEVINENNSEYCLKLLKNLITDYMDIMREELIIKGGIRTFLACLTSLNHRKKYEIITLLQVVARDIKGAEEMMAHNGIQVLMQLLVVGLNDGNYNYGYIGSIINIIRLLVNGLEDPMKLLMSLIDDIDVLEIHTTLLHRYGSLNLSFLSETLDVYEINIAKKWLNFLGPPFNAFNSSIHKNYYEDDFRMNYKGYSLIQLFKHTDIASMIMANEGILERFLIRLSKGNLGNCTFKLLKVLLQHERVAIEVVHQRASFIKELLQLFRMQRPSNFTYEKGYNVASLLFILAKHGGEFIKFIVNSDGIKILLNKALSQDCIGRCDVIKVLGIMAQDGDHALQIEDAGGSKMLLRVISSYLQYVHDTHLETVIIDREIIAEYEDDHLVMCCLKTLSFLFNHEAIAKQMSTRREDSKECGIIALVDVMQTASQLWSSITLTLRESVVSKKLMQIKGHMLTILSKVVSTLVLMAKLHPHIISKKVNENVLKGIFQLEGMAIDEHQTLKKALQDLLDTKKFHIKTWSCQQLCSKTIDIRSYEGKLGECQAHFKVKGT